MNLIKISSLIAVFAMGLFSFDDTSYYTKSNTKKSFSKSYYNLNNEEIDTFMLGKSFFRIPWVEAPSATTARDGLGPLFDANTCTSCHPNNSQGSVYNKNGKVSRTMVIRLSIPSNNSKEHKSILLKNGFVPAPVYGAQLSINGTRTVPYEGKLHIDYVNKYLTYNDGQTVVLRNPKYSLKDLNYGPLDKNINISIRKAPALVGLGLLEDLSNEEILKNEDEFDSNNDGISGRANKVFNIASKSYDIGRYTYKASAPTVKQQSAAAFNNDMGLTSSYFPKDNCTKYQEKCLNAKKARHAIDVTDQRLDAVAFYLKTLKVPRSKNIDKDGQELFEQISCNSCHVNSLTTKKGMIIKPYSDFLLHDMGEALSDGRSEFKASSTEWRTMPLWGISSYEKTLGKKPDYLHDGRAQSIEEAILWHGGEALKAREAFMALEKEKRNKIIQFIGKL